MTDQLIPRSEKKRIVIIGGGFGGINLVKKLHNKGFQIVLIDKNNYHTFQPLLYQVATGGLEPDSIAYPLRKIFQGYSDFYFRMAKVNLVESDKNLIHTSIGSIHYDFLVLALGSTNNFFGMSNIAANAMPMKSLSQALDLRSLILQNMERSLVTTSNKQKYLNFVIAGGGPTGVETAGALCELKRHVLPNDYPELDFKSARIILAEAGPALLAGMSEFASRKAKQSLTEMGVEVMLNSAVKDFDGEKVILKDGTEIPTVSFIWSAGVKGEDMPGLKPEIISKANRISVDSYNKVIGYENVFAIGDIAFLKEDVAYPNGHPMVAQVAIQQADRLAHNLIAVKKGKSQKPFKYKNLGSLATIGRNKAVADFSFLKLQGFPAWIVWMAVHLMTIVGFRNRLIVFINWVWSYLSYDRAIRLIIRPFHRGEKF
ncbi:MAG TPA: NAD(P)/FAD-dependent oxidoreductase [Bacteroidia bacterium]|nr:NAD(P)/FAD-dependent oxidoreductase [Bacteroidia bacterium]